ncbi:hypothetical protein [Actomonas aquatica]|uniref:DoxX family protein n=1 Tax=Actomonas aquatica TaxID=2866162 RepID=A0ABZ1CAP3_9BACT|nr:hypothetical protein [Opitutus sp. WL0086]WRQ88767.1 hypothetical protein K1X11_005080 [Opitutus sp. WL0086]
MSSLPRPTSAPNESVMLPWILRIGVAGCFIGHGAFGIITKSGWLPYFAVAGIPADLAWQLMPIVGTMDILMGISALVFPTRALFLWAGLWAVWTASLRPLAGEPFWETLERAGNYGVPFALLAVVGLSGPLFKRLPNAWPSLDGVTRQRLAWTLRITTALLLIGHAGLGLFSQKAGLGHHYESIGLSAGITPAVGAFEFFLAAMVLLRPAPALLIGVAVWKLLTEMLFLPAGAPFWEVIERFGSYTAPLTLALMMRRDFPRLAARSLHTA